MYAAMQNAVKNEFVIYSGHIPGEFKHYVYRLIRTDKNEPFYIGIGTNTKINSYQRAKCAYGRSALWNSIAKKSDYRVEIIFESNNYDEIKKQECYFISLYGRINLNTGILVNLTDGGDGSMNFIHTPESRALSGKRDKKPITEETRKRLSDAQLNRQHRSKNNSFSIPIFQYGLDGLFIKRWDCMMDIERELGITSTQISRVCKGDTHQSSGFYWFKLDMGPTTDFVSPKKVVVKKKPILVFSSPDVLFKEFKNSAEVSLSLFGNKKHIQSIIKACLGDGRFHNGYYFKYKS